MTDSITAYTLHALRKHLAAPAAPSRRKRSVATTSALWTPGQTLRISFMDDTAQPVKSAIFAAAIEWLDHANLEFERVDDNDTTAEIRITTGGEPTLNYSEMGNASLKSTGPSMHLGCPTSAPLFQSTVLHEFGHALGLQHEHRHPESNIPWDFDKIRALITRLLTDQGVEADQLQDEIEIELKANFLPLSQDDLTLKPYDPKSIMHYKVNPALTIDAFTTEESLALSDGDKRFIRSLYPGRAEC